MHEGHRRLRRRRRNWVVGIWSATLAITGGCLNHRVTRGRWPAWLLLRLLGVGQPLGRERRLRRQRRGWIAIGLGVARIGRLVELRRLGQLLLMRMRHRRPRAIAWHVQQLIGSECSRGRSHQLV